MSSKPLLRKHLKGQEDHIDAWLISYADLITLLFTLFVIFVSVSIAHHGHSPISGSEPEHPYVEKHSGVLTLGTPYDDAFRAISGLVEVNHAGQSIAIDKSEHGLWVDMSAVQFFAPGTADIPDAALPLLKQLAAALKAAAPSAAIEVEGYTDDAPLKDSPFANNWELSSMRAARIVSLLVDAGVDPSLLHAVGYAGEHPLVANTDMFGTPIDSNRLRNQRVVIKVERKAAPKIELSADSDAR